jgi:hypothetical protein
MNTEVFSPAKQLTVSEELSYFYGGGFAGNPHEQHVLFIASTKSPFICFLQA